MIKMILKLNTKIAEAVDTSDGDMQTHPSKALATPSIAPNLSKTNQV